MLHAARIGFVHPKEKKFMEFESPLPEDMQQVLRALDMNIHFFQTNP
jgi:hypothetical protein